MIYNADLIDREIRVQKKTNRKIAEAVGLSEDTVSSIRNGNESVSISNLSKVALSLNIPLHKLFEPKPETAKAA